MDYKADYIYKLTNLPIDVYIDLDSQKIFVNKKWYSFQIPNVPFECLCVLAYNCGIVLSPGQIIQSHKEWRSTQYTLEAEDNILISKTISKIHVVLRKVLLETLGEENIKTLLEIDSIDKLIIIKTHKKTGYQFLAERIPKDKFLRSYEYNDDNKKTDSPFTESLYTILSATLPNRRGTNTTNKVITVTRYTLFTLINHLYPNETELLEFLSDGSKTPEELNSGITTIEILNPILTFIPKNIVFEWQINYNGKNTGLVIVKNKNNVVKTISNEQYKSALDLLVKAYSALPQEFHNNVKSLLKKEINTTISQFVLAVANMALFNKSEHSRAELLSICDCLVKTHNHHNSYLFSLIEKTRDGKSYLFKEFSSEDFECMRAIEIIKNFFHDNWLTDQAASSIGTKFLDWCNDKKIIYDLINNYCYDQKIWMHFALRHNGINTLRQKVQYEIYQKTNLKNIENLNNITSFLLMLSMDKFDFLAYSPTDEKYNKAVKEFIIYILDNVSSFPKKNQGRLINGLNNMLIHYNSNDTDNKYVITKEILSKAKIDWSMKCYAPLEVLYNKVYGIKTNYSPSLESLANKIVAFSYLTTEEKNNSSKLKENITTLRTLLSSKGYFFNNDAKKAAIEILDYLLNNPSEESYLTVITTADKWYLFPEIICEKIYDFVCDFLISCDYTQQDNSNIKRALTILKNKDYKNANAALEKCFLNLNRIKKCRSVSLLPFLLEGLTIELIISNLEKERNLEVPAYSSIVNWLLANESNRKALSNNLNNKIIFDFIDALVNKCIESDSLHIDLTWSIIYFAKNEVLFSKKTPSSNEVYQEILLDDLNNETIDYEYLKYKTKENHLSENTVFYHICNLLKDEPHTTAYLCIQLLSTLFGQLEYNFYHPNENDLYDVHIFQKRLANFQLLISNPAIKNTTKFYCEKMRAFANKLPTDIVYAINNVVKHNKYPEWLCDIVSPRNDVLKQESISISKLKCTVKNLKVGENLAKEINNDLIPWLAKHTADDYYEPKATILAFKEDGVYKIIDGKRAIDNFFAESEIYGDFKIKIWVVELK